jgi:hypothetical protein
LSDAGLQAGGHKTNFRIRGGGWCQFSVTDPRVYEQLVPLDDGSHPRNTVGIADDADLFLLVSLSEPFEQTGNCYKLVAGTLDVPTP